MLSTKTSYSSLSTGDANNSNFIANCKYYNNASGDAVCNTCNDNYVLRSDGSECLSITNVPNCETAQNEGDKCEICKEGYALLSGSVCTLGTIANCKAYPTRDQKTEV